MPFIRVPGPRIASSPLVILVDSEHFSSTFLWRILLPHTMSAAQSPLNGSSPGLRNISSTI